MATKKELQARIAQLEVEVAILKAQGRPINVLPRPSDVPWPQDHYPFGWPKVWCGTTSTGQSAIGTVTFNASAA